ncbi:MAG: magnesium transporter [Actinomycetota bacterium]
MAIRHRARRIWSTLRAERRTLRQGSIALLLSTAAAFAAGLFLGSITDTLAELPGLLILIPASVGLRGTIFGAMAARLGTGIHAGTFDVARGRRGVLGQNVEVAIALTFASSIYLAVLAKVVATAFGETSISLWDLLTISVIGATLASAAILFVTIGLAVLSYHRGYDLDTVATPIITAVGDMVAIPALFLATFLVRPDALNAWLAAACLIVAACFTVWSVATGSAVVRRILLESVGIVLIATLLDVLAGTLLEGRLARFELFPGLLILVPPFVSQAGALGGILAARLSSKLQLGVITPRGRPEAPALVDAGLVVAFAVVVFTLIGVLGVAFSDLLGKAHPGAATMIGGTMLAGVIATAIVLVVGYYAAVLTARFGLDPDNHSVPFITSFMDLTGVLCLLFAMSLLGAGTYG